MPIGPFNFTVRINSVSVSTVSCLKIRKKKKKKAQLGAKLSLCIEMKMLLLRFLE